MGASVIGYCPDMTEDLEENQPGFWNDCKAWGDWMAERYNHPEVLQILKDLNCNALLSVTSEGVSDDDIDWVTPNQLREAALKLKELVLTNDARVKPILDSYSINANDVDPIAEEFAQDLLDVAEIATFFEENQVAKMTLEVNW